MRESVSFSSGKNSPAVVGPMNFTIFVKKKRIHAYGIRNRCLIDI